MAKNEFQFLPNPPSIRKAVSKLSKASTLKLAVAFVGPDWRELLSEFKGRMSVICWLSSTNTNPYAVADLMRRPNTTVRQRDSMHCKVYLAPKGGVVVGSANLSRAALADDENAGQDEAAVLVTQADFIARTHGWFNRMWRDTDTRPISKASLAKAQTAWMNAQQHKRRGKPKASRSRKIVLPMPDRIGSKLRMMARGVRKIDLIEDIGEPSTFVSQLDPRKLSEEQRKRLVEHVVSWTGHPSSYNRFLKQPIREVRRGLSLLFDGELDLEERLNTIHAQELLWGLRMRSLSLLLYWRDPELHLPYNHRTIRFLTDFKLKANGMSAASATCYVTWLRWATRFAQLLKLPTPGHLDRMVESYYEDVI